MKFAIFGLTVSSSWGNGHATLWRGLVNALAREGHHVTFYERDVPYYAENRDLAAPEAWQLVLYPSWDEVQRSARLDVATADVVIVTSYCPDALAAAELAGDVGRGVRVFYDLDTPVTLDRVARGEAVGHIGAEGYSAYDLVISYTGGRALDLLRDRLNAARVAPLYGSVDPVVHARGEPAAPYRGDLSYLGTFAPDRQRGVDELLLEPARRAPARTFVIGGAAYPADFPWRANINFVRHLPPSEHGRFFAASRLTLNVTREPMVRLGWCPSGRLFEAAAAGAVIVSDVWDGLDAFFTPGEEILLARSADDVLAGIDLADAELAAIGRRARARALDEHTAEIRARQLVRILVDASGRPASDALPSMPTPARVRADA